MANLRSEKVLAVTRWTGDLFSFRTTRAPSFRFESGMFTMIGLPVNGRPLLRAYSIASPAYADELEFLSIVAPGGALTARLQHVAPDDEILVGAKPTGTLLLQNLRPGRNLYLLATGTGLAAFMGLVREPDAFEQFERVVLVHGVRHVAELAYRDLLSGELFDHPYVGELARARFSYCPTVTREAFLRQGRITELLVSGRLSEEFGVAPLDLRRDRLMLCGSSAMLRDLSALLEQQGFTEGPNASPGDFVVEKAFADQVAEPRAIAAA